MILLNKNTTCIWNEKSIGKESLSYKKHFNKNNIIDIFNSLKAESNEWTKEYT